MAARESSRSPDMRAAPWQERHFSASTARACASTDWAGAATVIPSMNATRRITTDPLYEKLEGAQACAVRMDTGRAPLAGLAAQLSRPAGGLRAVPAAQDGSRAFRFTTRP